MRRILLAGLFLAVALAVISIPADAQNTANKDNRPGYIVLRVLLDSGPAGGAAAPGTQPGQPAQKAFEPERSIAAVVPYTYIERRLFSPEKNPNKLSNPYWIAFKHKYGMCFLYGDKTFVQWYQVAPASRENEVKHGYEKWSTKRSYDGIHDLCLRALGFGMADEAQKYCDEYLRMPSLADRMAQTDQYKQFAAAYKPIQEKLAKPLPNNEKAEEWKSRVGASSILQGLHYSLLIFNNEQQVEAKRRLGILDANFKSFYLWYALKGVGLPLPQKKLIAIMSDSGPRLTEFSASLDSLPVASDAFYSPSHNVLMLAPERMDQFGNSFMNLARARYASGWNRDELVRGRMPSIEPQQGKAEDAARHQTLAVADQFTTEEADNAAISREGCRQLMNVTGLLPQYVRLPGWLEQGIGFYYQRSKSPLYLRTDQGQWQFSVALASGIGHPNIRAHREFDKVKADLKKRPENTLWHTLAGLYYAGAASGRDYDKNPDSPFPEPEPPPGTQPEQPAQQPPPADPNADPAETQKTARALLIFKAEGTAWALIYYLQNTRLPGLMKFYEELGKMPRDLRLEEMQVIRAFCKAFALNSIDGKIDGNKFKKFAEDWLQYMGNVQFADHVIPLEASMADPFATAPGANPAGPGNNKGGPGGKGGPPPNTPPNTPPGGGPPPPPPGGGGGGGGN